MRPGNEAADLVRVAVDARKSIHLVKSSKVAVVPPVVSRANPSRVPSRKRRNNRGNGMTRTFALAGEALLAPLMWLGNARLLWLDRK
jgi:hypothetical protein